MQNTQSQNYAATSRGVSQRMGKSKLGKKARKSGYLTPETAALWITYAAVIVLNAAIEGGRLGGVSSADVTFQVYTWFTPAPYAFSIWSVVYIGLAVWLVSYTRSAPERPRRFGPIPILFIAASVLNVLWLVVFHFQQVIPALIVIVALWAVLVALYLTCRRGLPSKIGWVPISLYLAWVSVATITNAANLFTRMLGGTGIPVLNELSAIVLSAAVLAVGYVMKTKFDDATFSLVFLWAVVAVGVNVWPVNFFIALIVFALAAFAAVVTFAPAKNLKNLRHAVAHS